MIISTVAGILMQSVTAAYSYLNEDIDPPCSIIELAIAQQPGRMIKNFKRQAMATQLLILLSTAKNLSQYPITKETGTQPLFKDEINILIHALKQHSLSNVSKLMKLSTKLAKLNYDRIQAFNPDHFDNENASQALFTFHGQAYEALDAASLSNHALDYLKNHLYIISGLYGFLRSTDWMQPYRLEMGTSLKTEESTSLYDFWKDKLTLKLNNIIKQDGITHIVNCASEEYASAINFKALSSPVINCQFKDFKNEQYKTIGIYAKKARGLMVRYLAETKASCPETVQAFNLGGYAFSKEASTQDHYVFLRKV